MFGLQPAHLVIILVNLLMLAIPVIVIAIGVYLALSFSRWRQKQMASPTPLDVLKMRYAKGEITKEQFEQMKKDLEV